MSQIINSIKTDKFKRWTLVTMVTSKNNQKCKVNALHMYIPQLLGLNLSFCTETPCTRGLGRKSFKCALKMFLAPLWRANAADVFKCSLRIHKLIIFRNHFCIQWCTMIASFSDFTNELLMDIKWLVKLQKWKFKSSQNNAKMRLKRVFILTLQPVFIESMLDAIKGSICKLLSLIFWGAIDAQ